MFIKKECKWFDYTLFLIQEHMNLDSRMYKPRFKNIQIRIQECTNWDSRCTNLDYHQITSHIPTLDKCIVCLSLQSTVFVTSKCYAFVTSKHYAFVTSKYYAFITSKCYAMYLSLQSAVVHMSLSRIEIGVGLCDRFVHPWIPVCIFLNPDSYVLESWFIYSWIPVCTFLNLGSYALESETVYFQMSTQFKVNLI